MTRTAIPAAGEAVPAATSSFIDKLMEPLPEAELVDPKLKRLEQRARGEARDRRRQAWSGGLAMVEMAEHKYELLVCQARAHRLGCWPDAPSEDECRASKNAWGEEIDRQMQVPAPTQKELKWKKKFEHVAVRRAHVGKATLVDFVDALDAYVNGDKKLEARQRARAEAIARDEARLAKGGRH